jgi:hypothetical protein
LDKNNSDLPVSFGEFSIKEDSMTFPILVKEIFLGTNHLRLLTTDEIPCVEWEDQFYNHIWLLVQKIPAFSDPRHLKEFSEVSNFLWKGLSFQFINCITDYQKFYLEQIELEKNHPGDIFPFRLTDYKIFDVSIMHEPRLQEGHLSYFVYNNETGLPYRVVCPFPYNSNSTLVHYQILPLKAEAFPS